MIKITSLFLAGILSLSLAEAKRSKTVKIQNFKAEVISCHDGDTCKMKIDKKIVQIRFGGIDTPELKQAYGAQAQLFTENLIKNKMVDLACEGKSYKRKVCTISFNGTNINEQIVKAGWAYDSPRYSKKKYALAEQEASRQKLGLWQSVTRVSPFCYRHPKENNCKVNTAFMQ